MTTIQCKSFISMRCGHSRKFLETSWKKLQKEFTEYEGNTIEYQQIENTPENSAIFKLYGINAYPKTFLAYDHVDGQRRLEAISGNAPYERCKNMLTDALTKIVAEKEEWDKHLTKVEEAKKAEDEERRLMSFARAFLAKDDVRKQLKEFANSEEKLQKERKEAERLLKEAEEAVKAVEEEAEAAQDC